MLSKLPLLVVILFTPNDVYAALHRVVGNTEFPDFFIREIQVTLFLIFVLLCLIFVLAENVSRWLSSNTSRYLPPPVIFGLALSLCYLISVGMGLTGSSLKIGLKKTPFVQAGIVNIFGKEQPIRTDEYSVFTPFAIAQYAHQPKFPVINRNSGENGQNMLIIGMTGVPVDHVSSFVKPAIWGFFLFDLKRALSWYWLFPVFACLIALWGVVALLIPGHWRASFLIALSFIVSPYVVAWSNWPAYAVFFPSLSFVCVVSILRSNHKWLIIPLGPVLGGALAGFVLLLYPPWQVSLGYVFLALTIGIAVRDRLYNIDVIKLVSFGLAMIVASLIVWEWYKDAYQAIQAIQATIYPGQRNTVLGGNMSLSSLLRGFTNISTLSSYKSSYSNQSEIASFYYMFLPLAGLFAYRVHQRTIGAVEIALFLTMSFILYFMFAGIPLEIAQVTFWGRVPTMRADIALGLSYIVLGGVLLLSGSTIKYTHLPASVLAIIVALLWAVVVYYAITDLHESIIKGIPHHFIIGLLVVVVILGYFLLLGRYKEFILLNLILSVASTWNFNPITIAPSKIAAEPYVESLKNEKSDAIVNNRILVLGSEVPAMYLLASGFPVVNGIHFYPQGMLWRRLDKDQTSADSYNRYQRLVFSGGDVEENIGYTIKSPYPDVVRVEVDLVRFDFRLTGAGYLSAPQHKENVLRSNKTLFFIQRSNGWSWFQVRGDKHE
jgi:hypothetical protein